MLSWHYISFEFFDLIIQHEFELLKLLGLFLELLYSVVLIMDRSVSFFDFVFLRLDLLFEIICFLLFRL